MRSFSDLLPETAPEAIESQNLDRGSWAHIVDNLERVGQAPWKHMQMQMDPELACSLGVLAPESEGSTYIEGIVRKQLSLPSREKDNEVKLGDRNISCHEAERRRVWEVQRKSYIFHKDLVLFVG